MDKVVHVIYGAKVGEKHVKYAIEAIMGTDHCLSKYDNGAGDIGYYIELYSSCIVTGPVASRYKVFNPPSQSEIDAFVALLKAKKLDCVYASYLVVECS